MSAALMTSRPPGAVSVAERSLTENPFGGVSLGELRSITEAQRNTRARPPEAAVPPAARAVDGHAWHISDPTFDELVEGFYEFSEANVFPVDDMDLDYTPVQARWRFTARTLLGSVGAVVIPGVVILGALLWTTSAAAEPPTWLPQEFWFGPWAHLVGK
jgi:hypothetical protein